ncbi:MAG: site-2 protease family protein [Thermogutta sp.]|nr:site-2 protease family protein [Thermogutta sp.]
MDIQRTSNDGCDCPPAEPASDWAFPVQTVPNRERAADEIILAELVPPPPRPARRPRRNWALFVGLLLATCFSTFLAGGGLHTPLEGLTYSVCVMTILLCHEMGHFLQAVRYRAPATLPIFLPMPFSPIGTFGAVIAMDTRRLDRRQLFDIGISGPLAGLIPSLIFCVLGLYFSEVRPIQNASGSITLGEPLVFQGLTRLFFGELPNTHTVYLNSMAFAGWVGLLVTSLNLFPIGQLDGGHILYALLGPAANLVSLLVLMGATAAVVLGGYWGWILLLFLLGLMGPAHPPTADDNAPLGWTRRILGWAVLLFPILGFTPQPLTI